MRQALAIFLALFFCFTSSLTAMANPSESGSLIGGTRTYKLEIDNRILAWVKDEPISVLDLTKKMELIFAQSFPDMADWDDAKAQFFQANWKALLQKEIDQRLIVMDSENVSMKISDLEVKEEMMKRFGVNIITGIAAAGLSYEEARKMVHQEMIVNRMIGYRVHSKAWGAVTHQNVKDAYVGYCQEHPAKEIWDYQVITLTSASNDEAQKSFDWGKALGHLAIQLLEKRCSFEELEASLRRSLDPEVVHISTSDILRNDSFQIADAHAAVLSAMEPGQISLPTAHISRANNQQCYRIFYLQSHAEEALPHLGDIAERLRSSLLWDAAGKEQQLYSERLRHRYALDVCSTDLPDDFQPFSLH